MLFLTLVIISSILFAFYSFWTSTYWSRRGVKGPNGLPIFGNMFSYMIGRKHNGVIYEEIYKAYPGASYVGFYRVMNEPAILVTDLEMVKDVMVQKFPVFRDNVAWIDEKRDPIVMYDPFMIKGDNWKPVRSEFGRMATPSKTKQFFPHISLVCKKLSLYLEEKVEETTFEAKDLCSKFTLDVVTSAACGLDAESFTNSNSDLSQLLQNLFMPSFMSLADTTAFVFSQRLADLIQYRSIPKDLQDWLTAAVASSLCRRRDGKRFKSDDNDVIQGLINEKQKTGEAVDEFAILGHCSTFIIEGFETSATLMAFALYEFTRHPEIQEKVHREIDRVLEKFEGHLSYEATLEMTYLEAVLYEILRVYPPVQGLSKHCTVPYELPPQFKGTKLRKPVVVKPGTVFVIPVLALHSDPEIYPDPQNFDPERFSMENKHKIPACAFLSFGEGPRICPGIRFGLTQAKAGIATMFIKYQVELSPKSKPLKIAPRTYLTVNQDPILINFKPRNN